jgi:hypothetical protein
MGGRAGHEALLLCLVLALDLFLLLPKAHAGDGEPESEIMKGIMSSFSLPLGDLLKKKHESEWRNLFSGLSCGLAFNYPLRESRPDDLVGSGSQGEKGHNMTLTASMKYNPLSYWYVSATFYKYLRKGYQASWDPDFSYVFGYDDWHPYTFSLTYSNYGGNRLRPDRKKGERFSRFEEGTFSLGWKFVLPEYLEDLFTVHPDGGIGCVLNYNLSPSFFDLSSLESQRWKQSVSLSIKYTIYRWWYANMTLYWYPRPEQQQAWGPDFTYGFGYFDWHAGTVSIQYNNYSGNRYPWRKRGSGAGTIKDGTISISWSWAW